jgi:hypothetical protein
MQAFGEAWSSASATDLRFFEHDDTVVVVAQMEATNRALARDQHFVKVMPRDFVGQRLSGTGGLPG